MRQFVSDASDVTKVSTGGLDGARPVCQSSDVFVLAREAGWRLRLFMMGGELVVILAVSPVSGGIFQLAPLYSMVLNTERKVGIRWTGSPC